MAFILQFFPGFVNGLYPVFGGVATRVIQFSLHCFFDVLQLPGIDHIITLQPAPSGFFYAIANKVQMEKLNQHFIAEFTEITARKMRIEI
jgi:hypothetical protein